MDDADALDLAVRAAFRAGRLAAARLGDPGYLSWKGHRDVIAGAALEVQEIVVSAIRAEHPDDRILAEEGPEDEPLDVGASRLWVVDPICGSLNFVHGVPFFAVSIALRVDGDLRVGVVHDPMREETFAARRGAGATLNGRPAMVITPPIGPGFWEQATVGTDLPHSGPRRTEALRVLNVLSTEVLGQTIMGSPALSMAYVAAGRQHAYWTLDAKPWDVAAACVILLEAGALLTDAEGGPWQHSDGTYLAANPVTHKWALQSIKSVREGVAASSGE
jgi:myo-inositol-1(or 4)-monophosphatase